MINKNKSITLAVASQLNPRICPMRAEQKVSFPKGMKLKSNIHCSTTSLKMKSATASPPDTSLHKHRTNICHVRRVSPPSTNEQQKCENRNESKGCLFWQVTSLRMQCRGSTSCSKQCWRKGGKCFVKAASSQSCSIFCSWWAETLNATGISPYFLGCSHRSNKALWY